MSGVIIAGSLAEVLFQVGIITENDIRAALDERERTGRRFGEALVNLGIVTAQDIAWALSRQLDIPFIRLNSGLVDRDAALHIPSVLARRHQIVPIIRTGDELRVAMSDPLDHEAIQTIEAACGCSLSISISEIDDIRRMLELLYGPETDDSLGFTSRLWSGAEVEQAASDPTGAAFLDFLLNHMVSGAWSSFSFHPDAEEIALTGYHQGHDCSLGSISANGFKRFVASVWSHTQAGTQTGPARTGRLTFTSEDGEISFRLTTLDSSQGIFLTIRKQVVPETAATNGPDWNPDAIFMMQEFAAEPGIVLFVGRDHDERYQMMALFAVEHCAAGKRIVKLGDGLAGCLQGYPNISLKGLAAEEASFVLDAALDHAPQLILLDILDDSPSLWGAAGRAALTGVTIAAGIAASFHEAADLLAASWCQTPSLAYTLTGIVALRQVTTLCPQCRVRVELSAVKIQRLQLPTVPGGYFDAPGCSHCNFTGTGGRLALMDVIPVDTALIKMLGSVHAGHDIIAFLTGQGLLSAPGEGARLLADGRISPDEYVAALCT